MKNILVLGGSQFMGKSLLESISTNKDYLIYYINRNKFYWNNEVKKISNIHFIYGDREEKEEFAKLLIYLNQYSN